MKRVFKVSLVLQKDSAGFEYNVIANNDMDARSKAVDKLATLWTDVNGNEKDDAFPGIDFAEVHLLCDIDIE